MKLDSSILLSFRNHILILFISFTFFIRPDIMFTSNSGEERENKSTVKPPSPLYDESLDDFVVLVWSAKYVHCVFWQETARKAVVRPWVSFGQLEEGGRSAGPVPTTAYCVPILGCALVSLKTYFVNFHFVQITDVTLQNFWNSDSQCPLQFKATSVLHASVIAVLFPVTCLFSQKDPISDNLLFRIRHPYSHSYSSSFTPDMYHSPVLTLTQLVSYSVSSCRSVPGAGLHDLPRRMGRRGDPGHVRGADGEILPGRLLCTLGLYAGHHGHPGRPHSLLPGLRPG